MIREWSLPVALLLRRARNAKSAKDRHDAALHAWEAAVRLLVAARPPRDFERLAQGSFAQWALAAPADPTPLHAPAVLALLEMIREIRRSPAETAARAVPASRLFEDLAAYARERCGGGDEPELCEAMKERLLDALESARDVGLLTPGRLLFREASADAERRVLELAGCSARLLSPRETEGLDDLPSGKVCEVEHGEIRSLHPWVLFRRGRLREQVFFFQGASPLPAYLDLVSGKTLEGPELERAFPGVADETRALFGVPSPPVTTAELAGQPARGFADFEILGRLGVGGMGVVHLARQRSLDRLVALKVLPLDRAQSPRAVRRFEREVSALARCDHPNVVKVLASGRIDGTPYYAMEYVEGADLAHVARELPGAPDLSTAVARAFQPGVESSPSGSVRTHFAHAGRPGNKLRQLATALRDAARGLHHLHEHGVIHRDVKPGNLMITVQDGRVVVMDLGLALLEDSDPSLTRDRSRILGTLRYMAPEQLQDNPFQVDRRADVYSLGAVFYELFTGRSFLDGNTEARLIEQVLHQTPPGARHVVRDVPRDLDTILRRATEKNPQQRYETADALARDVDCWIQGRPITARPPTLRYVAGLAVRRHRALAYALAASLVVLVVTIAVFLGALAKEREQALERAQEAERERARAEELAAFMLFDLREGLESIDRLDLMGKVARKARSYYEGLAPDERDPEREFRHAKTMENLAQVLEAQGALDDALAAGRAALAIHERLSQFTPDDPERELDIALAHNRIGNLLRAQGDLTGGMESLREALRMLRELAEADTPLRQRARECLVVVRLDMGNVLRQQGELSGAKALFQESLDEAEALLRGHPGGQDLKRHLLVAQTNVADVLLAQGDRPEALELYRAALALAEQRVADDPSDADRQRDLFVNRIKVGDVLKAQGMLSDAAEQYRAGVEVVKRLVERDRENTHWQRDLLLTHQILGDVLYAHGDTSGALQEHRHASSIAETLARLDPSNALWQGDLSSAHLHVGQLLVVVGQPQAALEEYDKALEVQLALVEKDPTNTRSRRDLAAVHFHTGEAHLTAGDAQAASRSLRDAVAVREWLVGADPTNAQWRHDLALALSALGEARLAGGDGEGALEAHRRVVQMLTELVRLDPTSSRWKRSLAVAHGRIGDTWMALQRPDEAEAAHVSGLELLQGLLDEDPANAEWRRDLSVSHHALAAIHLAMRDYPGALAHSRLAVERHRELVEGAPHFAEEHRYLEAQLRAVELLAGAREPEGAPDLLRMAGAHYQARSYELAAVKYSEAIAADPSIRSDFEASVLYNAACAAALVQGAEAAVWQQQALQWLKEDIARRHERVQALEVAAREGNEEARETAAEARHAFRGHVEWAEIGDPDLESLRKLPEFDEIFRAYDVDPDRK